MNALSRFYKLGAEDADRRVAAALAPVRTDAVDRYLKTSRLVTAIDRATIRLREGWRASESGRAVSITRDGFNGWPAAVQYQSVAVVLLIAVATHIALMLLQGPRPGWFWLVIPGMTAAFAGLVIAGSQSSKSAE